MNHLELLSPAGDMSIFKAVIKAGADAVYVGGPAFGARAYANNFSKEELLESLDYAHIHNRQVYLTVNTLLKENELKEELYDYLLPYYEQGLDAVIVQDFGVMNFIKEAFPGLSIHASTQMTVTGVDGAAFLQRQGASRIVTARELSFDEIKKIKEATGVEIESFVHGALCYCYSGQCLMSSMLGGRSGNRGRCAQPCRLPYEVLDSRKKSICKEANYILSPKDLCTASMIPELAECGIDSFKIEGRMKQAEYAAGVTSIYRKYVDRYEHYGKEGFQFEKKDEKRLLDLGSRSGFTKGYYLQHNGADMITFSKPNHTKTNEALHEEIRNHYIEQNFQEKIKGNLKLFLGKNATLTVSFGTVEVTVAGDVLKCAEKKPLDKETVFDKMTKTGNTPFVFEDLEIEMEEEVFLPIGKLNALRREALELLQSRILESCRRKESAKAPLGKEGSVKNEPKDRETKLSVSLEKTELLKLICSKEFVDRVYLDADTFLKDTDISVLRDACIQIKEAGKQAFLLLPSIFREATRSRYESIYEELNEIPLDGMIVKNYEEIGFLKRHGYEGILIADHNLYTYSNQAQRAFAECGITENTVPLELNRKELYRRDCQKSELLLYGYLPLMVTAGCIHKSLRTCEKKEEVYYIKDRYGKEFAVKNHCTDCYNIIYNSSPLALFGMYEEIKKIPMNSYRIHFSTESKKEAEKILSFYENICLRGEKWDKNSMKDYTNGHLKRGVE